MKQRRHRLPILGSQVSGRDLKQCIVTSFQSAPTSSTHKVNSQPRLHVHIEIVTASGEANSDRIYLFKSTTAERSTFCALP